MPTISYFYGIRIYLPPKDHNPPHFHVEYAEYKAQVDMKTGSILAGKLPPKARGLTEEWRIIHLDALLENWQLMLESKQIKPINGLD
jgi:hypothetical protein